MTKVEPVELHFLDVSSSLKSNNLDRSHIVTVREVSDGVSVQLDVVSVVTAVDLNRESLNE